MMANYVLRNIAPATWSRVKARACAEGWPLRALLRRLLEDYGEGRISPSGPNEYPLPVPGVSLRSGPARH